MNYLYFYHEGLLEDRERYFLLDIIRFIQNICEYLIGNNINILTYEHFNKIWQNNDIQYIHQCMLEWESQDDYYNLLYGVILSKLINSPQFIEKQGLFYLLYNLYETMDQKILISLDLETMNQLYFFFEECKEKQIFDVLLIFSELNKQKALLISSRVGCKNLSIHQCGLPYTVTKRNKQLLKQITEEREEEKEKNERITLTQMLLNKSEEYHKIKRKYNIQLEETDSHFAQRCIYTLSEISQK